MGGIDGQVQILNNTVSVFESRHAETVEKFKEIHVITNTIQTQMRDQEQKMFEQSVNDFNDIREQLQDIANKTNLSSREIEAVKKQTENLSDHFDEQFAKFEDVMDKKINSEIMPRIGHLDDVVNDFENDIKTKFKPTEERLNGIDGQVQKLNTTVAVFESRHTETINKLKEVSVITNTIQTQIRDQEKKMPNAKSARIK